VFIHYHIFKGFAICSYIYHFHNEEANKVKEEVSEIKGRIPELEKEEEYLEKEIKERMMKIPTHQIFLFQHSHYRLYQ